MRRGRLPVKGKALGDRFSIVGVGHGHDPCPWYPNGSEGGFERGTRTFAGLKDRTPIGAWKTTVAGASTDG